ncbi:MBL fold metallo-hydrolase [Terricaulis sp.]|uniref:MBL fold metallo-hydrolase n=1 Tax=Terricaulis sp. TaxID=2768686 RepID=UPI003784015D
MTASDCLEISVLGRGYGESIVLHVPALGWIVVDSFLTEAGSPAALEYIKSQGGDLDQVVGIVATHWHDDHIQGISDLLKNCRAAQFSLPIALQGKQFRAIAYEAARVGTNETSSGAAELLASLRVIKGSDRVPNWVTEGQIIHRTVFSLAGRAHRFELEALSPSKKDVDAFLLHVAAQTLAPSNDAFRIPEFTENDISMAAWGRISGQFFLLGADLEERKQADRGWNNVLARLAPLGEQAGYYKIAHHGAKSGHSQRVWSELCVTDPVATIAPWTKGGKAIPTEADCRRIQALTSRAYVTTRNPLRKPQRMASVVEGKIRSMNAGLRAHPSEVGRITATLDVTPASPAWRVELHGRACELGDYSPAA